MKVKDNVIKIIPDKKEIFMVKATNKFYAIGDATDVENIKFWSIPYNICSETFCTKDYFEATKKFKDIRFWREKDFYNDGKEEKELCVPATYFSDIDKKAEYWKGELTWEMRYASLKTNCVVISTVELREVDEDWFEKQA